MDAAAGNETLRAAVLDSQDNKVMDVRQQVNRIVREFVDQATQIAARAAMDTLHSMRARPTAATVRIPIGDPSRRSGSKRTPDEIEGLAHRLVAFIRVNPGLRIEQINSQLGTKTTNLALPIRKLIAERTLQTRGHKRSTTYYTTERSH